MTGEGTERKDDENHPRRLTPVAHIEASPLQPAFRARDTRQTFWESYSAFVAAFREAAEKLKAGDRAARFPLGSFPPALPFVSAYPSLPP